MFRKWIVTFGGLGLLPAVPGTYASLGAAVIYYGLWKWLDGWARLIALGLSVAVVAIGQIFYAWAQNHFNDQDPRQYVLDEAAGQWLTLMLAPVTAHMFATIIMGFFLFRAFDVAKPFPINRLERIPGAAGVLLDDLAAGIGAAVVLWILVLTLGPALEIGGVTF